MIVKNQPLPPKGYVETEWFLAYCDGTLKTSDLISLMVLESLGPKTCLDDIFKCLDRLRSWIEPMVLHGTREELDNINLVGQVDHVGENATGYFLLADNTYQNITKAIGSKQ